MLRQLRRRSIVILLLLGALGGCVSQRGVYHTVGAGESMASIARAYGQSEVALARINNISDPSELRRGSKVFIPNATRVVKSPSPATKTVAPANPQNTDKRNKVEEARAPARKADKAGAAASQGKKAVPPPTKGRFDWPVTGEILRRFGETKPYPCKGLEVGVKSGTPVLAAAAGKVIYSDDGIRSFGKMVIIKHDDDYYTVYAFNKQNLVAAGSYVGKGEKIAFSGRGPEGGQERLYFEIRYHKEPVDPTFYLPTL